MRAPESYYSYLGPRRGIGLALTPLVVAYEVPPAWALVGFVVAVLVLVFLLVWAVQNH